MRLMKCLLAWIVVCALLPHAFFRLNATFRWFEVDDKLPSAAGGMGVGVGIVLGLVAYFLTRKKEPLSSSDPSFESDS